MLLIAFLLRGLPHIWILLLLVMVMEFFAIREIIRYDEEMCERLGFLCPHCHKALYESRSFINLNAKCPKCRKNILELA